MDQPLAIESVQGPLTSHRIRFDGVEGRAGSYDPTEDRYTVFLDRGYTVDLRVQTKYLEDLGEYTDPMSSSVPWEQRSKPVECTGFAKGIAETAHTTRVSVSQSVDDVLCWECKVILVRKGNA